MNPKWFILLITMFVACSLYGGVIELAYLGTGTGTEQSTLNAFFTPLLAKTTIPFIGNIWNAVTDLGWWYAVLTMASFDYVFLEGIWGMFAWLFFIPIGIAIIVTFALAAFRGVGSG